MANNQIAQQQQEGILREDDASSTREYMMQMLKEKEDQIDLLTNRIDEALKAVSFLTQQQSPQNKTSIENQIVVQGVQVSELPMQVMINGLVAKSVSAALASNQASTVVRKGMPYPAQYEDVPYPPGFVQPKFRMFNGKGNPKQHMAHYKAICGTFGGSQPLLFKQFVASLSEVAFTWYTNLPNESVTTFDEMEDLFIKRFAPIQTKVSLGDLAREEQELNETLQDYILRWRNLSIQCEPQIGEEPLVELLIGNIKGPITPHLRGFDIKTFQELLDKVVKLVAVLPDVHQYEETCPKPSTKKQENQIAHVTDQKREQVVAKVVSPQQAKVRSKQRPDEKHNKRYSFKRELTGKILATMINGGFELPKVKKPDEAGLVDDPLFCPYHRYLGHIIEDCFVFKNKVEEKLKACNITMSKQYLLPELSVHATNHMGSTWQPISGAHICMIGTLKVNMSSQEDKHNREKYQGAWESDCQGQEEITRLKDQNKKLGELVHQLLAENGELKKKVKVLREAVDLMTTHTAPKSTNRKGKVTSAMKGTVKQAKVANTNVSLQGKIGQKYSFKEGGVKPLFDIMLKGGLLLPKPKRLEEVDVMNSPNYCPYHRCIGHTIEDCFVFKDLLEKKYQENVIHIPQKHLMPKKDDSTTQSMMEPLEDMISGKHLGSFDSSDEEHIIKGLMNAASGSMLLGPMLSGKLKIYGDDSAGGS